MSAAASWDGIRNAIEMQIVWEFCWASFMRVVATLYPACTGSARAYLGVFRRFHAGVCLAWFAACTFVCSVPSESVPPSFLRALWPTIRDAALRWSVARFVPILVCGCLVFLVDAVQCTVSTCPASCGLLSYAAVVVHVVMHLWAVVGLQTTRTAGSRA